MSQGVSIARFWPRAGGRLQDFRRKVPEISAEGAVLENFCEFLGKLFLKKAIKTKNLGKWG